MKITKKQLEKLVENQVRQIQEGKKKVAKILGAIQMLSPEDKQLLFSQMSSLTSNVSSASSAGGGAVLPSGSSGKEDLKSKTKKKLESMLQSEDFTVEGFRNLLSPLEPYVNKQMYVHLYWSAEQLDDLLEDYSMDSDEAEEIIDDMLSTIHQL